jgi:hypothetical protein
MSLVKMAAGGQPVNALCVALARGQITDLDYVHKFGVNLAVGTGAFEIIESAGGTYPWPVTSETVRVKAGGNAADTVAGLGARKVMVIGLDENWAPVSEEIELAGASASSPTTSKVSRVFRAYVTESGAYGAANTAAIVIENTTATQVLVTIAAAMGQTQIASYSVAANKQAVLVGWQLDVDAAQPADLRIYQRPSANVVAAPFGPKRLVMQLLGASGAYQSMTHMVPIVLDEYTDFWCEAKGGAGAAKVSAEFDLLLFDKES